MAIFRTDKERKVHGERVVGRKGLFAELDEAVARLHSLFSDAHRGLVELIDSADKGTEENEAEKKTEQAVNDVTRLYRWAYNQLTALVTPDWNAYVSDEQIAAARERLFPIGNPNVMTVSQQLVLESVSHLITALKQEKVAQYPQTFFEELTRARETLVATLAAISKEPREPREIGEAHRQARALWDNRYTALHEVTQGFLRLASRFEQLDRFFGPEQTIKAEAASEEKIEAAAAETKAE